MIHYSADWWISIRRHFNQIQANIVCAFLRIMNTDNANIVIAVVYQPNLAYTANISVDPIR